MTLPKASSHQLAFGQLRHWIVYGRLLLNVLRRLGHICLRILLTKVATFCTLSALMEMLSNQLILTVEFGYVL